MPTRRFAVATLATVLAGYLLGGGGHLAAALLSDSEPAAASIATAACFTPDDVPPAAGASVIAKATPYLVGSIRQGGAYQVYANVTDGGCAPTGVATVLADLATITTGQTAVPLVAGAYTIEGLAFGWRSASLTANAVLAAGTKAYTLTSTDAAGNGQTQSGFDVRIDNTRPTAADVQTANGGATVGKPEPGDRVTLTYDEPIDPQSVLAGWTGATTTIVVRITHNGGGDRITIRNAANAAQLPLGTVDLEGKDYVTATRDFGATGTPSTMAQSGASITITLGSASGTTGTETDPEVMTWTPATGATDAAGNASMTTDASESGPADVEF